MVREVFQSQTLELANVTILPKVPMKVQPLLLRIEIYSSNVFKITYCITI